jgi:heptaprenyl diphosphate synthase
MAAYHIQSSEVVAPVAVAGLTPTAGRHHSTLTIRPRPASVSELFMRADLTGDMQAVEQLLLQRAQSRSALIAAASEHTVQAGGKRLRAALALLAARLGSYSLERVIHAAASVELIHAASLVHDDLVDQADRRRGHVTVHARWDNDVALMVGDYFFALATSEMALSPDPRIITFYAEAVQTIVAGELNPVTRTEPFALALRQYIYKTGCKTAALFEAAAKAGMAAGGGDDAQIAALGRYGYDMGLAFQIIDDVLDFTGDERSLGKPAGNDLRQGTITLPLIYAVADQPSQLLRTITERSDASEAEYHQAIAEVVASGAIERTLDEARSYVERAVGHLAIFPASPAAQALSDLAFFVIDRQS